MTSFAWTANHGTADYEHYPPYVNLTGNRLVVRGPEKVGMGHVQQGERVEVVLTDEALAELRKALAGDEIERLREALEAWMHIFKPTAEGGRDPEAEGWGQAIDDALKMGRAALEEQP